MHEAKHPPPPDVISDDNLVDWAGTDDPDRPINWPRRKKLLVASASGSFVFVISFASSAFAPARARTAELFDVSEVVMSLGVSLFIVGFAIGPLLFAPLSEVVGHASMLVLGLAGCAIFQIPFALAANVPTLLISRLLQGGTSAALMSVGTGMFAEVFEPVQKGVVVSCMACCMNLGSAVAPVVCGFVVQELGWRWIGWVTLILASVVGAFSPLTVRETSPRIILLRKSRRLRDKTGNLELRTKYADDKVDFGVLMQRYILVPVKMFWTELILVVLTVYLTFVYGTLYLAYQMFPISFTERGWTPAIADLPFIAVSLGIISAWAIFSVFTLTWYKEQRIERGTVPELRLPPMILGSIILPVSLLWFGWSGGVHWISQVFACYFIGLSLQLIFMSGVVYIVDVYGANSNCAMSIQVVFRSLAAASFPLWSPPMYRRLGVPWSSTLLAGISLLLMPFPILFMHFGKQIRKSSRYAAPVT
jgi:MFS transporter, DHA1 family, multidrug resistance protein